VRSAATGLARLGDPEPPAGAARVSPSVATQARDGAIKAIKADGACRVRRGSGRTSERCCFCPEGTVSRLARWWLLCSPCRRPPTPATSFSDSSASGERSTVAPADAHLVEAGAAGVRPHRATLCSGCAVPRGHRSTVDDRALMGHVLLLPARRRAAPAPGRDDCALNAVPRSSEDRFTVVNTGWPGDEAPRATRRSADRSVGNRDRVACAASKRVGRRDRDVVVEDLAW
jgi:hypothetical protein